MDEVKVIQVIYCSKKRRGAGTESSPVRLITEIFDFEGNLISEKDPCVIYTERDMVKFAMFVLFHKDSPTPVVDLLKMWNDANNGKVSIDDDL